MRFGSIVALSGLISLGAAFTIPEPLLKRAEGDAFS